MTREVTKFETLPQAIDLLFQRLDEIEAKIEMQNKASNTKTNIFLEEAAKLVGKSTSTLYKLAKSGKIPAYKNGKQWNFIKEELQAWMTRMPHHSVSYIPDDVNDLPKKSLSVVEQLIKPKRGKRTTPLNM